MNISRREFLLGAAALGLGGWRLFAAPLGWKHGGKPNLVFGVVSDTHLRTAVKGNGIGANWPDKYFVAALEYFRKQDVDAVVHCGDMAHRGQVVEMQFHANVWHKEVKGYHFFGRNWGVEDAELVNLINSSAASCELDNGTKPFFFLTHTRPEAPLRKAVCPHRNAVSFFGHNHWSASNWNMAYLYYKTLPAIEVPSCEPRGCDALVGDNYISKAELSGREVENVGKGRQAYVVRLYDDMMAIERHEFSVRASSLGADWVMPFGKTPHPFSKEELTKVIGEPQFRKGARLAVSFVAAQMRLKIPLANGNPDSRVYAYEVEVTGDDPGNKLSKAVYAAGVNMGIGHEPNGGVTTLEIQKSELPTGKTLTIAARPITSLGTSGRPIITDFKV